MNIIFSREKMHEMFEEFYPLWIKHWEEIAYFKDVPMDPSYDMYTKMENTGMLRTFVVRDDNKLIGYCIFIVVHHLHYKSHIQAVEDVIYIDPSYRGHKIGKKFIEWCDEELKKDSVTFISHHVKAKHNFGTMLEKLGYNLTDLMYVKKIR